MARDLPTGCKACSLSRNACDAERYFNPGKGGCCSSCLHPAEVKQDG